MGAPANLFFRDELRVALVEKGSCRGLVAVAAMNEADLLGVPVLDAARVVGRLVDRKAVLVPLARLVPGQAAQLQGRRRALDHALQRVVDVPTPAGVRAQPAEV